MRDYRKYTDEDVIKNALKVKSLAGLLKNLGLRAAGGNYVNMKKTLQRLDIDCSHWTGQAWNKNQQLKDWSKYSSIQHLKPHLIKERGHKCENCGLEEWLENPIPLEIDHIDGDRTNNKKENLKLLCCNCHALTPTWRGRNIEKKEKVFRYCEDCGKKISISSKSGKCSSCFNRTRTYLKISKKCYCKECKKEITKRTKTGLCLKCCSFQQRKIDRPPKEQLLKEIEETNYCAVGRKYGVTGNTVRKWL